MNIVIQAGGKGKRLQKYTRISPKCLISVNQKTLLYHNIDILDKAFPNSNFYIVCDHKAEILSKYLKSYPHPKNPKIILPEGTGTCSGIREIILKNKEEPILITWCDLYFTELSFSELHNNKNKNFIGISDEFSCRWSYSTKDQIIEEASSLRGIAGFFIFPNPYESLSNIPFSGEFVRWLSLRNIKFEKFYLRKTFELGDIKEYENLLKTKKTRCRFFNKVTISESQVIKECIDPEYKKLILNEINWYNYVSDQGYQFAPGIFSDKPLVIGKIEGEHPDTIEPSGKVIDSCIRSLKSLHSIDSKEPDYADIIQVYIEKTIERVKAVSSFLPIDREFIFINDTEYFNPFFGSNMEKEFSNIKDYLIQTQENFVPIHGDSTFSNILYTGIKDESFLIDPRGIFGSSIIFGDSYYDFAKLIYSVEGSYDNFNNKNFELIKYNEDEFFLTLPRSKYINFSNKIYSSVKHPKRLILIHALIWFSLCGYVKDHIDSIIGAFLKGVIIYDKYKKSKINLLLSTLPKTWLLDIDGTIVKHNGHKLTDKEQLLPEVKNILERNIRIEDTIILTTSRKDNESNHIKELIKDICKCNVKLVSQLPHGERILINDQKESGLNTAYAINVKRDNGLSNVSIEYDSNL